MAVQDFENLVAADGAEGAFGEHGADGFAVGAGASLERVDDGQCGLAFAQVVGDGLEDLFGGGEVEDVIDDLESEADGAAVVAMLVSTSGVAWVVAAPSCMER